MSFPENFYWGGASAANQFEGGFDEGSKGHVATDFATAGSARTARSTYYQMPDGSILEQSGFRPKPKEGKAISVEGIYYPNRQAVDFYHRYKDDIQMLADLGLKMFRMSIAWSRIYPTGLEEKPNQEGLDFYRNVFEELKKYGIEPLVTMSHYDTPLYIEEELGGWSNPEVIDLYEKYARTIFEEYKGLVKYWLTFNEINCELVKLELFSKHGVSPELGQNAMQVLHHQFVASAKAVLLAHKIDPEYKVGCMIAGLVSYPLTPDPNDVLCAQWYMEKNMYYCADVMVRGEYPYYTQKVWKELGCQPVISPKDLDVLKAGVVDFYSFSYYSTLCKTVDPNAAQDGKGNLSFGAKNPKLEYTEWGWGLDGKGLRYYLNTLASRYGNKLPLMVVENGIGYDDILEADGSIHDPYRIAYMKENIEAMEGALEDGVNLIAYTPWGIIDLISASTGEMKKRYGVIYVDLDNEGNGTLERYPKDSYYWYKELIANNGAI